MVLHIRIWLAFLLTESIGEGTKTCIVLQLRFCATCLFETLKAFPVLKQRTWRSSDRNQDACSKRAYLPCYARASFFVSGQGFPRYSLYVFLVTAHTFSVRFSRLRPFPFPVSPLTTCQSSGSGRKDPETVCASECWALYLTVVV